MYRALCEYTLFNLILILSPEISFANNMAGTDFVRNINKNFTLDPCLC